MRFLLLFFLATLQICKKRFALEEGFSRLEIKFKLLK